MAKYRHRIFEMFDFRDEAISALTRSATPPAGEVAVADPRNFKIMTVTRLGDVTHVEFTKEQTLGEQTVSDLRRDFSLLVDGLALDSKVLFDFSGVKSYCAESIDALVVFNRTLRHKGSKVALCCLDPTARETFFAARTD